MLPITHPAVAYLCYALFTRTAYGTSPGGWPAVVVALAAILSDLVDQPLAVLVGLTSTRTLAHSLLVAVPVAVVAVFVARRFGRDEFGTAFAIGYLSHPLADTLWPLLVGAFHELGFLLWPVTRSPPYEGQKALGQVANVDVTTLWIEAVILVIGLGLWYRDGTPGTAAIVQVLPPK